VAEDGAALVGYVSGYCHTTFYAGGKTAWIDELLVVSRCRQHGVGRLLMDAFEAWAEENSCKLVSLATAGASGFYERLGYGPKQATTRSIYQTVDLPPISGARGGHAANSSPTFG